MIGVSFGFESAAARSFCQGVRRGVSSGFFPAVSDSVHEYALILNALEDLQRAYESERDSLYAAADSAAAAAADRSWTRLSGICGS